MEISELSSFDNFLFYGESPDSLELETQSDIMSGLMQSKRSLYYDRSDSCGVVERENTPTSFVLSMLLKYDITLWIAYRNTQVTDGQNGNPDRRVASSQNSVSISNDNKGNLDISISYIPFADINQTRTVSVPLVGGSQ